MDAARREFIETELPLGVSEDDARDVFEQGWKAAIEWVKRNNTKAAA